MGLVLGGGVDTMFHSRWATGCGSYDESWLAGWLFEGNLGVGTEFKIGMTAKTYVNFAASLI